MVEETIETIKPHYHFVGIAGIGMGALAALLCDKGYPITGSDMRENAVTKKLRDKGVPIFLGHDAAHVQGAHIVVYSSAIPCDNPELLRAQEKGLRIMKRAELLAYLMHGQKSITVAGAHGKTTTSAMLAHMLIQAQFHPTIALGGVMQRDETHAHLGEGEYFVAEVDESDGSFLNFDPWISVITNMDREHIDYYPDWESILDAYDAFIQRTQKSGKIIAFGDDKKLFGLLNKNAVSFLTYGFQSHNDLVARKITYDRFQTYFDVYFKKEFIGSFELNIPGEHNVANALACILAGLQLEMDVAIIQKSLKSFSGVQRRFHLRGMVNDITIVDDYAHHPTEIRAVLHAAHMMKKQRLIAVVQPHRYSRLKHLKEEFIQSLLSADHVVVTDIYAASEEPMEGVSSSEFVEALKQQTTKSVVYVPKDNVKTYLTRVLEPGDIVMLLGAGDITKISEDLFVMLNAYHASKVVLS